MVAKGFVCLARTQSFSNYNNGMGHALGLVLVLYLARQMRQTQASQRENCLILSNRIKGNQHNKTTKFLKNYCSVNKAEVPI